MADSELLASVQAELVWEPSLDEQRIMVFVKDGDAALAGRVPSQVQKWAAETAIKRIAGVRGIANDIEVEPAPQRAPIRNSPRR